MSRLFLLSGAVRRDPRIEAWFAGPTFAEPADAMKRVALAWFEVMRGCGDDVRELLHDGFPVALVQDAPFAYVNAYKAHVGVGFFQGASLSDPSGLLEGAGVRMRHVKLRLGQPVNEAALNALIAAAYRDIRHRLASPEGA